MSRWRLAQRFSSAVAVFSMLALAVIPSAHAQEISLKSGESAELGSVYWVANCVSQLVSLAGVDQLAGPPGLTLTIREQPVIARQQNCPNPIPGGIVIVSVGHVSEITRGKLEYRVRYNTPDGLRQSTHSSNLALYP